LKLVDAIYILTSIIIVITLYFTSIILGIPITIVMNRSIYEFDYASLIYSPYNYVAIIISTISIAIIGILRRDVIYPLLLLGYALLFYMLMDNQYLIICITTILNTIVVVIQIIKGNKLFLKNIIHYLILTLIAIEIFTTAYIISIGPFGSYEELMPLIFEKSIYAIPITILPYIVLILLFKWIVDIVLKKKIRVTHSSSVPRSSFIEENALVISIVIALLIIMSPYIYSVGRSIKPISEDTSAYAYYLSKVEEEGFPPLITNESTAREWRYVFQRPLHFIILYIISKAIMINPVVLLDYIHHIVCISLILLLIWLITKKLFNPTIAGLATLLTACGPLVVGFRVGGFQANEMNLVFLLTYFLVLIVMKRSWHVVTALALGITSWFIHPWTATFFILSSIPFIPILYIRDRDKGKLLKRVITVISLTLFPLIVLVVLCYESVNILNILGSTIFNVEYGALMHWSKANIVNALVSAFSKIPSEIGKAIHFYCWSALSTPFIYIPCLLTIYDPLTLALSPIALISTILFSSATYIFRLLLLIPYSITSSLIYSRCGKFIQFLAIIACLNTSLQITINTIET